VLGEEQNSNGTEYAIYIAYIFNKNYILTQISIMIYMMRFKYVVSYV